ncbi:unnamed protein product [Cuscuta campestris]|uniref:mannan endo-1,4-beta-mannosidase n=1 Tax=Cuscuta campestris TaxID=132261 RepID=A0A484NHW8_9ASTE|nr:unnamed protein product [Cuscuta campestris]
MAKYLKSIDTNHLVEAGLEGFYGQSSPRSNNLNLSLNVGTDFISNNRISAIDFATTHVYPDQWLSSSNDEAQRAFLDSWLDSHIRDSQIALRKPLLVSEFGKSLKDAAFTSDQRDALYSAVFYKIYSSAKRGGAAAGGLFWQLFAEGMENFGDGYEIVLSRRSPSANLIAQQAHKLGQIRKILARMTETRRRRRQRGGASGRGKGKRIGN